MIDLRELKDFFTISRINQESARILMYSFIRDISANNYSKEEIYNLFESYKNEAKSIIGRTSEEDFHKFCSLLVGVYGTKKG